MEMKAGFRAGLLFVCLVALDVTDVHAQSSDAPLTAPREVVLHLHSTLEKRDFVGPLLCALKRALIAPVSIQDIDFPLQSAQATPAQLDVDKVARLFDRASSGYAPPTFRYLLLSQDMKKPTNNYAFAWSYRAPGSPFGIVSTARIEAIKMPGDRRQPANVTALRAYKLILKSVGRLAGLNDNTRCLLNLSTTVAELDRKSFEFCADDRARLVAARILKAEEEDKDCVASSERRDEQRFAIAD